MALLGADSLRPQEPPPSNLGDERMTTTGTRRLLARRIGALCHAYVTVWRKTIQSSRSVVFLTLLAMPNVAIVLLLFLFVPRLIFGLEDAALRRGLLTVALSLVAAVWLLAQLFLQRSVTWLLNIRELSPLPFGFNTLYRLRLAGYLGGAWLLALGLAAPWFAVTRSNGLIGLAMTTVAIALAVVIQGQIVSVVASQRDRLVEGLFGSVVVLVAISAIYLGLYWGVLLKAGESSPDDLLGWMSDSVAIRIAAFTPAGLLAGMLDDPEGAWRNGARLLGLCAYAALTGICDQRLLRRLQFDSPSGAPRVKHPTLPLSTLLRRLPALSPGGALTLIEIESGARNRAIRWSMLVTLALFGFLVLVVDEPVFAVVGSLTFTCMALTGHRGERILPTGRLWSESFALPVTPARILRAMARVPSLVAICLAGAALAACFLQFGWFGWRHVGFLVLHCAVAIFYAEAAYGWFDARWQTPPGQAEPDTRAGKLLTRNLLSFGLFLPFFPTLFLFTYYEGAPSPLALSIVATVHAAVAVGAGLAFRASTRRILDSRGLDALLGREDSEAGAVLPPASVDTPCKDV